MGPKCNHMHFLREREISVPSELLIPERETHRTEGSTRTTKASQELGRKKPRHAWSHQKLKEARTGLSPGAYGGSVVPLSLRF